MMKFLLFLNMFQKWQNYKIECQRFFEEFELIHNFQILTPTLTLHLPLFCYFKFVFNCVLCDNCHFSVFFFTSNCKKNFFLLPLSFFHCLLLFFIKQSILCVYIANPHISDSEKLYDKNFLIQYLFFIFFSILLLKFV